MGAVRELTLVAVLALARLLVGTTQLGLVAGGGGGSGSCRASRLGVAIVVAGRVGRLVDQLLLVDELQDGGGRGCV